MPKPIELDKLDNTLRAWVPEDKQKAPVIPLGTLPGEELPEDLQNLPGIDVVRGMSYCGTGDAYRKTLFLFREQIPGYLRRIRQDWEEEKWEDYSIEVHSLKSAARWIGAMDLGDDAETLEMAGRGRGPGKSQRPHPGPAGPVPEAGGCAGVPVISRRSSFCPATRQPSTEPR